MLKFFVFFLTLWQGIYEFSCQNEIERNAEPIVDSRSLPPIGPFLSLFGNRGKKIDADYTEIAGVGALKLHRRKLPWNQARRICNDERGHLVVIRSDAEAKIILRMMEETSIDSIWVGVHDQFQEGEWLTVMDEALGQTGWTKWSNNYPVNPDDFDGGQDCAVLMKDGGMDDNKCPHERSFVCKISSLAEE